MFGRWRRKKGDVDKHDRRRYEFAIKRLHEYKSFTLAMARFNYWQGWNVKGEFGGDTMMSPDDFELFGVVHEEAMHDHRIFARVKFDDGPSDHPERIGFYCLTHLSYSEKTPVERAPLLLQVSLFDPGYKWARVTYDAMRDAAISGSQFAHFRLQKEAMEPNAIIELMRDRRYGPHGAVYSLGIPTRIMLPKAPVWALSEPDPAP